MMDEIVRFPAKDGSEKTRRIGDGFTYDPEGKLTSIPFSYLWPRVPLERLAELNQLGYEIIDKPPEYAREIKAIENSGYQIIGCFQRNASVYALDSDKNWFCLNPPEIPLPPF